MSMITRPQPGDEDGAPLRLPNITPEFVALLELAAAERGLPPEPWPLPGDGSR